MHSRLKEISFEFYSKHRTDRGKVRDKIAERIGLNNQAVYARLRGDVPFADAELPVFLEELKLPLEV